MTDNQTSFSSKWLHLRGKTILDHSEYISVICFKKPRALPMYHSSVQIRDEQICQCSNTLSHYSFLIASNGEKCFILTFVLRCFPPLLDQGVEKDLRGPWILQIYNLQLSLFLLLPTLELWNAEEGPILYSKLLRLGLSF